MQANLTRGNSVIEAEQQLYDIVEVEIKHAILDEYFKLLLKEMEKPVGYLNYVHGIAEPTN